MNMSIFRAVVMHWSFTLAIKLSKVSNICNRTFTLLKLHSIGDWISGITWVKFQLLHIIFRLYMSLK